MKKILTSMFVFFAIGLFESCGFNVKVQNEKEKTISSDEIIIENLNSEIILGEKFENLFTVDAVRSRSANPEEEIEPNFIYFRCRSDDKEEIKWLSEKFDFMSIIPLDREILEGGTFYNDPELGEGEAPWYYFIKPIDDFNEVKARNITVDVMDEMYFDDDDIALLSGEGLEIPDDTYLEVDLEEDSSRGLWSVWKKVKKFVTKYIANYPKGKVSVYDTVQKQYVPVKNIQVISQQLGVLGSDYTNKKGNFSINVPYTSLGYKVQIVIRFENPNMTLSRYDNDEDAANSALTGAVDFYQGWHWIEGISDINVKFSSGSRFARYATAMNALSDYRDFCDEYSITKPKHLNILGLGTTDNSCAPLTRYTGIAGALLFPNFSPDIVLALDNLEDNEYTEGVYKRLFHELSHASHFFGLGSNSVHVWNKEYLNMLYEWAKQIINGKKPFDDPYNDGGTALIKLIESWGYFSENYLMVWKFRNEILKQIESGEKLSEDINHETYGLTDDYIDILENNGLDSYYDSEEMKDVIDESKATFYYGGFYDLIDANNDEYDTNGIIVPTRDFCSGYKYNELFRALVTGRVSNHKSFAEALVKLTNRNSDLENVKKTLNEN